MENKKIQNMLDTELRQRAETALREKTANTPEQLDTLSPQESQRLLHELRVHQIELEMQNEELRRAQLELEDSQTRYFDLYNLAPVGYCTLSKTGIITESNLTAAALLGVTRGEMVKQPFSRFILKDDQDILYLMRKQLIESGEPHSCELRMLQSSRTQFWAHLAATCAQDAEGVDTIRLVLSDVTERKLAESELHEKRELMNSIIDSTPSLIFACDLQHRFTLLNNSTAKFFGMCKEELLGKCLVDVFSKELADTLTLANSRITATGVPMFVEEVLASKIGNVPRVVMTSKFPIRDKQGKIIGLGGVTTDITERKQMEEEQSKLQAQLQQAQKMESVGLLAGGVAHDFNNMLGVIMGYTELAMDQVIPAEPIYANLVQIRKAAERSINLTQQLLAFARKQTIAPEVLNLNETVAGMLTMLSRLLGEDINISWHPSVSPWQVKVDKSQIDQILTNLCVNARAAITDVGKITIETGNLTLGREFCAAHPGSEPGEYVRLTVSDSGCGMDSQTLSRIFEPFFTTKGIGQGTGLGLASVYGAVKQNMGYITVSSEPGLGTSVEIYLPRHAGDVQPTQPEYVAERVQRGHETILLVEDESALRDLITRFLELKGYSVLGASSPSEAIRMAKEHAGNIHLLLTDVIMPEMNGSNLAKELLSLSKHLKCLFMSGYTADVIANHGVLNEEVHFIQKPFSMKNLTAKVRTVLNSDVK